ncbi:hypothetical protein [Burkholderia sp. Bp9016]|nr:hypothetical protein [Burkholderia sp. Bp9016]
MDEQAQDKSSMRGDYEDQWAHVERSHLILSTKEFIVVIDKAGRLDYETTPAYDAASRADEKEHGSIMAQASRLEESPSDCLSPEMRVSFKRLIGEAIAFSLDDDYENARKMLEDAALYFLDRSEETSRRWYLSASACMTVPFIVLGLAIWIARTWVMALLGLTAMWLVLGAVAGSMGALLSVIWRSGKLRFACSAGMKLHILEGASRIWAGALSGLLVALAVRFGIVLAPLSHGASLHGVMLLAAFAAGAGERLATSIISEVDSTAVTALSEKASTRRAESSKTTRK